MMIVYFYRDDRLWQPTRVDTGGLAEARPVGEYVTGSVLSRTGVVCEHRQHLDL